MDMEPGIHLLSQGEYIVFKHFYLSNASVFLQLFVTSSLCPATAAAVLWEIHHTPCKPFHCGIFWHSCHSAAAAVLGLQGVCSDAATPARAVCEVREKLSE